MKANKNSTYRYSNQLKSSQINSNQSNTLDSRSCVFLKLLIYASWYCDQILLNRQPHLHYSAHTCDQSRVYDQRPQMFDCRWFFCLPAGLFYTDPICNSKVRWKSFLFQAKWSSVFFWGGIVLACWKLRMIGFEFWSSINTVQMPKRVTWAIRPNHDHLQFPSIKLLELLQQWMKHLILGHIGRSSWLAIGHLKWCKCPRQNVHKSVTESF